MRRAAASPGPSLLTPLHRQVSLRPALPHGVALGEPPNPFPGIGLGRHVERGLGLDGRVEIGQRLGMPRSRSRLSGRRP